MDRGRLGCARLNGRGTDGKAVGVDSPTVEMGALVAARGPRRAFRLPERF